jgi:hypothetical protein
MEVQRVELIMCKLDEVAEKRSTVKVMLCLERTAEITYI